MSQPETAPAVTSLPRRGEHRRIMADATKLTVANGISYFVNLVGGIIMARILPLGMYGVWKTVQLALQYTQFLNAGVFFTVGKEGPALASQGRVKEYQELMGASMGFSFLFSSIGSVLLFFCAWPMSPGFVRTGLLFLCLLLVLQQLYQHCDLTLSLEKRFGAKAWVTLAYTVGRVTLCAVLAWWKGLGGALAGFCLANLAIGFWVWPNSLMGRRLRVDFSVFPRLLRVGFPITVITLGELVVMTADKWIVVSVLGKEKMALYQMAVFPLPVLMLVPYALRQVVNVELFDKCGRTGQIRSGADVYNRSLLMLALSSPLVIGAVYLGVPWLVSWLLPAYRESLFAMEAHAILIYPLLILHTTYSLFVIAGREKQLLWGQLLMASVCAVASILLIAHREADFPTALFVHGAGWLIYGVGLVFATQRLLEESRATALRRCVLSFLPMAFLAVELPALSWALDRVGFRPHTCWFAVVGGLLHTIACIPFFWAIERKTHSISDGWRMAMRRLGRPA